MGKNCVFGQSAFLPVCRICGLLLDDCDCPACLCCGEIGNPVCLTIHEYGRQLEVNSAYREEIEVPL